MQKIEEIKIEDVNEQTVKVYRAQDIYAKFQRIEVKEGVSITLTDPPLNISLHTPDHALYFAENHKDFDIIEFEIPQTFYQTLLDSLISQKQTNKDLEAPTFNDPEQPGFKIEIKAGKLFSEFGKQIIQTSGKVTRTNIFAQTYSPKLYCEKWVHQLAQETLKEAPKTLKQIQKVLKNCDIIWDGKDTWKKVDVGEEEEKIEVHVDWKTANEQLWTIRNKAYDQKLREKKSQKKK